MKSTRLLVPGVLALACSAMASPAAADVTLKSKSSGTGMTGAMAGDMTQYVKGTRTRTDQTMGNGTQTSTIIDVATQTMIVLDHAKKEATVIDMTAIGGAMAKAGAADIEVAITPTDATRQIAGTACKVYDMKVAVPMQMGKGGMTMVMTGPQCLAKNGPGQADFTAFYNAASAKGFFLDPNQAKAQPAAAKAMADMQRKMAELGVPLATEITITIDASGPMAEMMKKMGNTITTEVTSISTAAIPDAMFDVPADYKVSKR
ncbi:MAG TPA: DUF4412 domain-containing protein [Vicinamibacterales bacterium]|nr:DUF4412 domain-containing protein [Vicinamibacterales bacterium]